MIEAGEGEVYAFRIIAKESLDSTKPRCTHVSPYNYFSYKMVDSGSYGKNKGRKTDKNEFKG